ncbi:MAG TPA: hypothetical protein VK522_09580 [Pseudolabrys sp.]|nr:hypothetical protein [Pseudolabrys sp.]
MEFAFQTPLDGPTTGTVNPGLIWVNRYLQFAARAVFPVNARSGRDVGARAQIHFYLSEIFPDTLGKRIRVYFGDSRMAFNKAMPMTKTASYSDKNGQPFGRPFYF